MAKIGLFFGTQTGNTETIAEEVQKAIGTDLVDLYNFGESDLEDFEPYSFLIIGSPTWNIGELVADWEGIYEDLDRVNFKGKKVAYFGLGDQVGYSDNFMDAMGILEEKISSLGGQTVGYWPTDGYDFNESQALRAGKFAGLALDEDNQPELTATRIQKWVQMVKFEFGI